jgi:hypothetical protein
MVARKLSIVALSATRRRLDRQGGQALWRCQVRARGSIPLVRRIRLCIKLMRREIDWPVPASPAFCAKARLQLVRNSN